MRHRPAATLVAAATFLALASPGSALTCSSVAACVLGINAGSGVGVEGVSQTNVGLYGVSTANHGIDGRSRQSYGVVGYTFANGSTPAGAKAGVYGIDSGSGTYNSGIIGTSTNGSGVVGKSVYGDGVFATSSHDVGVYGVSTALDSTIGVYGIASGVFGGSSSAGVYGTTTSGSGFGVAGYVTGDGLGVYGYSAGGAGVGGYTGDGNAVFARAAGTGSGVYVLNVGTGYGVLSYTAGNVPFLGRNSNGNGADLQGNYIGVVGRAPASGGFPLVLTDVAGNNLFFVDGAGNVAYKGGISSFARSATGANVRAYTAKTTLPTVEDTGTAQLVNGTAVVRLDPTFASSIDLRSSYRVFVTPNGDTRGLFVTSKSAEAFIVREAQAGRASVSFDYRIVATALGQAGQRMAALDSKLAGMPRSAAPLAPKPPVFQRLPARPKAWSTASALLHD